MRVVAVLANKEHPELGAISIPIPIRTGEYSSVMKMLSALSIGDVTARDCQIEELTRACPTLRKLEGTEVNIDELDYLAKRLDGFDTVEITQFQAMADKLRLAEMKDLINLTFSCQQATVITDFSDLEAVGRNHYMNTHGGSASVEELEHLDGEETAILLIEGNKGTITRYGVVYDNGMQLSQLYDGRNLPCYHYESDIISVGLASRSEPENPTNIAWVYLPAADEQIERAMRRIGINDPEDVSLWMGDSLFPMEVDVALDFRHEVIYKLNDLAKRVEKLSNQDRMKLGAVVSLAGPKRADQVCRLIDSQFHITCRGRFSDRDKRPRFFVPFFGKAGPEKEENHESGRKTANLPGRGLPWTGPPYGRKRTGAGSEPQRHRIAESGQSSAAEVRAHCQ